MSESLRQVGAAKYVMLTTFRQDGRPVASPLWAAQDGDALVMWTVADSWKVKRIRRNPKVLVQACDARGRKVFGPQVEGMAEVLDDAGSDRVTELIERKYGIAGRITVLGSRIRRGRRGTLGVSITSADSGSDG